MGCLCWIFVWVSSTVRSSSVPSGELSACIGCRHGGRCLGYCFCIFPLFIFSCGSAYHVSASVFRGWVLHLSEIGWAYSEVSFLFSEVFVIGFWSGASMIPGLLDRVTCWWLCGVARSARGCVGFVEVWAWGDESSGNFSVVSLNIFFNVLSAYVCRPGWFSSWSCNPLTASMRYLTTLVDASLGLSIRTWLGCGYSLYWMETWIPPVVGTWNFRHL